MGTFLRIALGFLLCATGLRAQTQVTHVGMLECGLAYNEIFNELPVGPGESEIRFGSAPVTRHWITTADLDDRHVPVAYLAGSILSTTTTGFVQLQYSPDGGLTWLDCPQTLSLTVVGDFTGNVAELPADMYNRDPVLLRLATKGGGGGQTCVPLAIDLVIFD